MAARRRVVLLLGAGAVAILFAAAHGLFGNSESFTVPSRATLAGLTLPARIVAIANSQVGYSTNPSHSYCNKFSAHWDAGTASCPHGELAEEWCADFAAWAWQKAGVQFTYGYGPGEINGGAASFYEWGVANGRWHPATSGYVAAARRRRDLRTLARARPVSRARGGRHLQTRPASAALTWSTATATGQGSLLSRPGPIRYAPTPGTAAAQCSLVT